MELISWYAEIETQDLKYLLAKEEGFIRFELDDYPKTQVWQIAPERANNMCVPFTLVLKLRWSEEIRVKVIYLTDDCIEIESPKDKGLIHDVCDCLRAIFKLRRIVPAPLTNLTIPNQDKTLINKGSQVD